jgi:hypothetical protein
MDNTAAVPLLKAPSLDVAPPNLQVKLLKICALRAGALGSTILAALALGSANSC